MSSTGERPEVVLGCAHPQKVAPERIPNVRATGPAAKNRLAASVGGNVGSGCYLNGILWVKLESRTGSYIPTHIRGVSDIIGCSPKLGRSWELG